MREAVERPGDLQQPGILDRVVDPVEVCGEVACAAPWVELGGDPIGRHPRRVGELGIVVVAQDLVEVPGRRAMRVDVRMRVEDRPAAISSKSSRAAGSSEQSAASCVVMRAPHSWRGGFENQAFVEPSRSTSKASDGRTEVARAPRMNVLVTAGGTVAPIDDVRQITNASTGRFAAVIAEEAAARGRGLAPAHPAGTSTVRPPGPLRPRCRRSLRRNSTPDKASRRVVASPRSLPSRAARDGDRVRVCRSLEAPLKANPIDIAFLAMAVSDYAPLPFAGKLSSGADDLTIRCRRLPKVIQSVRDWSPSVYLVGFKLLSNVTEDELILEGEKACLANRADLTVANDLQSLAAGKHTVHLVRSASLRCRCRQGLTWPIDSLSRSSLGSTAPAGLEQTRASPSRGKVVVCGKVS